MVGFAGFGSNGVAIDDRGRGVAQQGWRVVEHGLENAHREASPPEA